MYKDGYHLMECSKCDHRFLEIKDAETHLANVYSDDYFLEGKSAGYPNYLEQKDILVNYGLNYARIVGKHTTPGSVLDTGCAAGFVLEGFKRSGWTCAGIEPNDTMASYGRNELDLAITTGSFEDFSTDQHFDLITMIQVIGHFYDLDKVMNNVNLLLNEKGLVLVESWNMKSTVARLLGKNWHEYSPPSVVNWFSKETLVQLFNYHGFKLIDEGFPKKKINFKHAISLFDEKTPDFKLKKRFFAAIDRLAGRATVPYPPLDLKWYLFRKIN